MRKFDIAVLGGGASGLVAAISAKRENKTASVAVIEAKDRVGKKLLLTGNGCCNLSNEKITSDCYFGDRALFESIYSQFDLEKTLDFFRSIGVETFSDEVGRIYPLSLQAGSVVDQLRFMVDDMKITTLTDLKIEKIEKKEEKNGFILKSAQQDIFCRALIVCAGSKAAPKTGSDGSGYELMTGLGHSVTKLYPALVQLTTEMSKIRPLTGIKVNAKATIDEKGLKTAFKGEILFTDYGISGPPILQISRRFSANKCKKISLDLLCDLEKDQIEQIIRERVRKFADRSVQELLTGVMNKRLGQTVVKCAGVALNGIIGDLNDRQITAIAENIKNFELNVTGTKMWDRAQVTAGGVTTEEFDQNTLQSKLVSSLYAAGELLNVDGMCGGYNLQWAWSSGFIAGQNAAKSLKI